MQALARPESCVAFLSVFLNSALDVLATLFHFWLTLLSRFYSFHTPEKFEGHSK